MNYTIYYYCSCEYEKVVHEHDNQKMKQCNRCYDIHATNIDVQIYKVICKACGNEKEYKDNFRINGNVRCESCYLEGEIGFDKEDGTLFYIELGEEKKTCTTCKKGELEEVEQGEFKCPRCFKNLKQKMSTFWEKEDE